MTIGGDPERSQSFVVSSQMKHFLFLIKTRKDRLASLSPEQMQQHVVNVRQFIESLISNGQIKVARAVEMTGFALSGFKGAFQEARLDPNAEVVSAYYLVGAESLTDALLLAKADPRFEDAIWKTEIQPILDVEGVVDRGIRVNTLSPGPTDTAMFGRVPGEEQGEAVKAV